MSRTRSTDAVLVPLVDRFRWTMATRLLMAIAVPAIGYAMPGPTRTAAALVVPALAMIVFVVIASPVVRLGRRAVLAALAAGLLLDGCYLAWAFHVLDGLNGLVGYLVVVHATSVTLLTSFRSGLKMALWHTLLLLVVIEAETSGAFSSGGAAQPFPSREFAALVAALWIATLATAAFAALNERELRRRRYDAEVLRRFAVDLEAAAHSTTIAERLARLGHDDLLATRAVVVCFTVTGATADVPPRFGAQGDAGIQTGVVASIGAGEAVVSGDPPPLPPRSIAATALSHRRTVLAARMRKENDGYLAELLPDARNLVVVPFSSDDEARGVLVLEFADRAHPGPLSIALGGGRSARIDRRAVATAEQAAAHAALAFGRTALVVRLKAAANVDGLTGIANRRVFDDALRQELHVMERSGTPFAVALVDLDHFKQLNDAHGHLTGDETLRAAAQALRAAVRQGDTVARYGGEEFVVIMRDSDVARAADLAEQLRNAVSHAAGPVPVTASLGVAASPAHGTAPASLLHAADQALYQAKAAGRNRVRVASTATDSVGDRKPGVPHQARGSQIVT